MSKRRKSTSPHAADDRVLRAILGSAVRRMRSQSEHRRQALLDRVGISAQAWSRIECGHCFPSIPTAYELWRELGLSLDAVFAEAAEAMPTAERGA